MGKLSILCQNEPPSSKTSCMRFAALALLCFAAVAAGDEEKGEKAAAGGTGGDARGGDSLSKLKSIIESSEEEPEDEQEEVEGEIEWNFEYIDQDSNGLVTKLEYREALQRYHKDWTFMDCVKQVDHIFKRADFDNNGVLSKIESMGRREENVLVDLGGPKGFQITTELVKIGGFSFVIWKLIIFGAIFWVINWVIENSDDGSGKRRKKPKKSARKERDR